MANGISPWNIVRSFRLEPPRKTSGLDMVLRVPLHDATKCNPLRRQRNPHLSKRYKAVSEPLEGPKLGNIRG